MGRYCPKHCSHLITKRIEIGGPPVGFQCTCYRIPNPAVAPSKRYKHWNRKDSGLIARELDMENGNPVQYEKCEKEE
jgi:hypothetical protein